MASGQIGTGSSSLRGQLIIAGFATISLLGLLSLSAILLMKDTAEPVMRQELENQARQIIEAMSSPLDQSQRGTAAVQMQARARRLVDDPQVQYLRLVSAEGALLYQYGVRPAVSGLFHLEDNWVFIHSRLRSHDQVLGELEIQYKSEALQTIHLWIRRFGFLTLLVVVIVAVVAVRFSRKIGRPMASMIAFAKEMGNANFSIRLPTDKGPQELRILSARFNEMSNTLQKRARQLISQQKDLEEALQTTRDTREKLMQSTRLAAAGELAGQTAHEVLNPLTSIRGRISRMEEFSLQNAKEDHATAYQIISEWCEAYRRGGMDALVATLTEADREGNPLVEEDLSNLQLYLQCQREDQEQLKNDLDFLDREAMRISRIVDSMRSLSRHAGTKRSHPLEDLLRESVDIFEDTFKKEGITAEIEIGGDMQVLVDKYELIQVISNLLRNAVLAIGGGDKELDGQILLKAHSAAGQNFIEIIDNGPGIPANDRERIFESSFTTRESDKGTGLGLAIAHRLTTSNGGKLYLGPESETKGAHFIISFPQPTQTEHSAIFSSHSQELVDAA